jgi:D-alanyl-lipoteichoic acid acyltransferase DltB (MBOAT superfamily)
MLFNSKEFLLVFLPLALAGHALFAKAEAPRIWFLVLASLVFYGWWDIRLVPLLVASVVVNWLIARHFFASRRSAWLAAAIVADLLCLAVFKYANFALSSLAPLGVTLTPLEIVLPLGISFFTFHHVMYLADAGAGRAPLYRFREYALYIVLFPQILAGPLVRHSEIVFQFRRPNWAGRWEEAWARGLVLLVVGLAKKVFLADGLAAIADPVFAHAAAGVPVHTVEAVTGTLAFTFQIYFDFSGYSDIALAIGLFLGLDLPINFDAPYRATSLRDFWRRWHMTLSRFLRDYVYIPLGGNRRGLAVQLWALVATMLLAGLWHGAGWSFVLWGGLHGVVLAAGVLWRRGGLATPAWCGAALTFLFVAASWVLFRAHDIGDAARIYAGFLDPGGLAGLPPPRHLALIALAAAVAVLGPTSQVFAMSRIPFRPAAAALAGVALALIVLKLGDGAQYQFIYFQF